LSEVLQSSAELHSTIDDQILDDAPRECRLRHRNNAGHRLCRCWLLPGPAQNRLVFVESQACFPDAPRALTTSVDQLAEPRDYRDQRALRYASATLREASRPAAPVFGMVTDLLRPRRFLLAENVLLRQQLLVLRRQITRPSLTAFDRAVIVVASAITGTWRESVLLVKPETILRWHRQGFQMFSRWRTRHLRPPQSHISIETIELIRRMARENRLWGAERIRGELLKLGIRVAKRTVQRYLKRDVQPRPSGQRWAAFLENHAYDIWACDFVQTYDIWFRPIFAFFIINLGTREVVHVAVTRAPTQQWTAQQLRTATPFGAGPRFLIRDRDNKFGAEFDRAAQAIGTRVIKTAVRTPDMNATCERFLGSVRRECLDHVVVLNERHFLATLKEYVRYFNRLRPHQGLGQRTPTSVRGSAPTDAGQVVSFPVLGGVHNDYRRVA
jgi:putative transposase